MSIKSILVHLAGDEEHRLRLKVAQKLAKKNGALVHALFITNPVGMPPEVYGRGASANFLAEFTTKAKEQAAEIEAEFSDYCDREAIDHVWSVAEGNHLRLMAERTHSTDLLITSQPHYDHFEDRYRTHLVEELALYSGLPTMMIPNDFHSEEAIGKRILLGWKSTREAVRATRDSLPLLKDAQVVYLLTAQPSAEDAVSLNEVKDYLARHGVNTEIIKIENDGESVGATILSAAEIHDCDLIVCGAYGHSRLRDFFVKGVTHHLVKESKIPLLMSH